MKLWIILAPVAVVGCLAACTTVDSAGPSGATASQPGAEPTPSPAASAETQAFVGWFIYDPLAPNWTIKELAIDAETYRLSLRAKQFRVEVIQQYTTRLQELLMLHVHDHGSLPVTNQENPPPRLGRLSPL